MPFDYEKHLIISVFSVECCLEKNNFRFFKAKKQFLRQNTMEVNTKNIYHFLLLENTEISPFLC